MLTFGSLFAGIGGFDLGLERAGMTCKWQVEINPFCQKVLAKHWPDVVRYADVKECGRHNLETVDLIAGGFPCQPHSVAGKRRGAADDRNLWPEMYRIIRELRPTWVLAENVLGIKGTILNSCLSDLESEGYWNYRDRWGRHRIAPLVIPACAFDAPHRRERIFIVAYSQSQRKQKQPCIIDGKTLGSASIRTGRGTGRDSAKGIREHGGIAASGAQNVAHAQNQGLQNRRQTRTQACQDETDWRMAQPRFERHCRTWWATEPDVGRMADGIPNRVDRLRALGNAVVPAVAQWLGERIVEVENGCT